MPQHLDADRDWGVRLQTLHEAFGGEARRYFYILLGAVGFILLIACANVANLLLARAATRQREFAIRASLGARRSRLLRQLLAESMLLALLGGSAGILLGLWGIRVLLAIAPIDEIRTLHISLDLTVLAFTLGLSVGTGILFGTLPALRASKPDLNESLKESGKASGGCNSIYSPAICPRYAR
jgi:putative ABC transport system permease protein